MSHTKKKSRQSAANIFVLKTWVELKTDKHRNCIKAEDSSYSICQITNQIYKESNCLEKIKIKEEETQKEDF